MMARGASTTIVTPPTTTSEAFHTDVQVAPAGNTTLRCVVFCVVTGATRKSGPSRNWSSTPHAAGSAGNSHHNGRTVGTPSRVTFAASAAMYGFSTLARKRTYPSSISCVALPYDQTSLKPHEPETPTQGATSGSDGPERHPCVRNTGEKSPNWLHEGTGKRLVDRGCA